MTIIRTQAAIEARLEQLGRDLREFLRPKAGHELTAHMIYEDPQGRLKGRTTRPTGRVDAEGRQEVAEVTVRLSAAQTRLGDPPSAEALLYCGTERFLRREAARTGRKLADLEAELDPGLLEDVRALHAFETMQLVAPQAARDALALARAARATTTPHPTEARP